MRLWSSVWKKKFCRLFSLGSLPQVLIDFCKGLGDCLLRIIRMMNFSFLHSICLRLVCLMLVYLNSCQVSWLPLVIYWHHNNCLLIGTVCRRRVKARKYFFVLNQKQVRSCEAKCHHFPYQTHPHTRQ